MPSPSTQIYRALEAVHGGHHMVQGRVEELLRSFGIQAADEFGGVLEVSKRTVTCLRSPARAGRAARILSVRWGGV